MGLYRLGRVWVGVKAVLLAMLNPPVIASLLGFLVALTSGTSFDLRLVLVDTEDQNDDRPLGANHHMITWFICIIICAGVDRMVVRRPVEVRSSSCAVEYDHFGLFDREFQLEQIERRAMGHQLTGCHCENGADAVYWSWDYTLTAPFNQC